MVLHLLGPWTGFALYLWFTIFYLGTLPPKNLLGNSSQGGQLAFPSSCKEKAIIRPDIKSDLLRNCMLNIDCRSYFKGLYTLFEIDSPDPLGSQSSSAITFYCPVAFVK